MKSLLLGLLLGLGLFTEVRAEQIRAPYLLNCSASLEAIRDTTAQGASELPENFGVTLQGPRAPSGPDEHGNFQLEYNVKLSTKIYRTPTNFRMIANIDRIERSSTTGRKYGYYQFMGGLNGYMLNPSLSLDIMFGSTPMNQHGRIRIENSAGIMAFYHLQCHNIVF